VTAGTAVRAARVDDVLALVLEGEKGNVLTGAAMRALEEQVAGAANDRSLKLVTIRGQGRHFSFGASVEEHRPEQVREMLGAFHRLIRTVAGSPVPVAAVVGGRCLGGAFELALACHFVLAAPDAIFACPEIELGVFPPVLAAIGALKLGAATAERLLLTGDELDAADARGLGLVTALAPAGVSLEEWALSWYRRTLAPLSAFALRQGVRAARAGWKHALAAGIDAAERQYLDETANSHDGREGLAAFLAKRAPVWSNS
jgi:cyclohexa-1,5-dienecarbonyl-CoA hydratase